MPRATQAGGVTDPELLRMQEEEEERRRQQAAEAAKPKKSKEQRQEKPTRDPLRGIKDGLKAADQAIENFVEDKIYAPIMGERGMQDYQKRKEEGKAKMAEAQKAFEEAAYDGPVNTFGSEAVRSVIKAPVNLAEGILNFGEVVKDTVGTGINAIRGKQTPENRNPFSNRYEEALYDFGVQGPKTSVGKLAEGVLTFGLGLRAIGARLPGALAPKATSLKTAVASGIVPGAMADLLLTKGNDGNLSQLVRDLDWVSPEQEDLFLFALATDESDSIWEAKLKTMLEGGVTGAAADALGWILVGRRAAQKALKQGKSPEEALQAGTQAADAAAKQADVDAKARGDAENEAFDVVRGEEFNKLREEEETMAAYADKALADFGEESAEYAEALKRLEEVNQRIADFDWEELRRVDQTGLAPQEKAAYNETADINDAVTAQMRAESGGIPRNARVNPADGAPGSSPATIAGAPKVLTDAAYKILDLGGAEKVVKDAIKKSDLNKIAKQLKRSYGQVVRDAANMVAEFRDSNRAWDDQGTDITNFFEEMGGTIKVDRGKGVETLLSPEGVVASKALIQDTANQIYDLARNQIQMGLAGTAGGNQMDRFVDRLVGLLELHKLTGNFHGFNLAAFKELPGDMPRQTGPGIADSAFSTSKAKEWGMKIKKMARSQDPAAKEELNRLVNAMVLAGGDPTKMVTFSDIAMRNGTEIMLKNMYQSLLSGPITHLRNLVGNTYATIERPLSIALNGFITGDEDKKRAAVAGMYAMRNSLADAWKIAKVSFATGESVNINQRFVLEDAKVLADLQNMKRAAQGNPAKERVVGFLEWNHYFFNHPWLTLPSRALQASDDMFKHINARMKVATDAMYKASLDATDINDIAALNTKYLKEFSKQIDPKTGEILNPDLMDYANTATFQQDPGSFINRMTLAIEEVPVAKLFMPFIRTPANILAYTGQHTPVLNRFLKSYKDVMAGSDELLKAEMKGREAIGGLVIGSAGTLALSGLMTGNGPSDPEEKALWEKTHQPRSVKIGGKWVSYESLEPLATIMTITADIAMLARMGNQNLAEKFVGQMVYAVTAGVTEKSFLAGLTGLASVLDPANLSSADRVTRGLLATLNNFTPYSGARRALGNILDPYVKEVDNELQRALMQGAPLYKVTQPSRIDIFTGEQITALGGGAWNALVPFRIKDAGEDPVVDTIVKMQYEYNQITKSGPKGEPLSAQEQAQLSRLMFEYGIRERIGRLIEKDWFKEDLQAYLDRSGKVEKRKLRHYVAVDKIIEQAKRSAFSRMRADDADFAERLQLRQQADVQARRGNIQGAIERLNQIPK